MLKLTYVPIDDDHDGAVEEYDTREMNSTVTGIQFTDGKTGMERLVHYKKITKVEFTLDVPAEFVNRAVNTMRLKKANAKQHGKITVK